jgi:hypothetical protein
LPAKAELDKEGRPFLFEACEADSEAVMEHALRLMQAIR